MTKKQQITFGILSGLGLMIIYLVLSLFMFKCPTESQYIALRIIIALGAASFASVIPGFIEIKYKSVITASGAIAVFMVILVINPKPIRSLSDCGSAINITGIVLLNNMPFEMAEIYLLELDSRKLYTNDNGNFNYTHIGLIDQKELTIRIKSNSLKIDTSIIVSDYQNQMKFKLFKSNKQIELSSDLSEPGTIKEYCIECIAKDTIGIIVNVKHKCHADSLYLVNYILGFSRASLEQSRLANCKWE